MNESSPLLLFIPEQGPFYVFLNLQEDVLKIYHFILERIYKETFWSVLPKKTKPFRISLVITAVFLAWTKLHHKVLQKFQLCKDIEYSCLLFLLDKVIPLSFFHYPVTFRSGNLDDYMATMLKLSISLSSGKGDIMTDPRYPCLVTFVFTSNISHSTMSLRKSGSF